MFVLFGSYNGRNVENTAGITVGIIHKMLIIWEKPGNLANLLRKYGNPVIGKVLKFLYYIRHVTKYGHRHKKHLSISITAGSIHEMLNMGEI